MNSTNGFQDQDTARRNLRAEEDSDSDLSATVYVDDPSNETSKNDKNHASENVHNVNISEQTGISSPNTEMSSNKYTSSQVNAEEVICIEEDSCEEVINPSENKQNDSGDEVILIENSKRCENVNRGLELTNKCSKQTSKSSVLEPSKRHKTEVIDISEEQSTKRRKTVKFRKSEDHSPAKSKDHSPDKRLRAVDSADSGISASHQNLDKLEDRLSGSSTHNIVNKTKRYRNVPKFTCEECGTTAGTMKVLKRHMRIIHILNTTTTFSCERCKKVFHWRCHRDKHESRCIRKLHNCPECKKKLLSKTLLKMHIVSEHIDKDFICDICSQAFFTQKGFKSHMSVKHKIMKHKIVKRKKDKR